MGVIKRQGIKKTVVTYAGVVLGAISTLFVYPLDFETHGYVQFLISTAMFLVPFAAFGINSLTVRFFPDFKNETNGHNGMLGFLLASISFSVLVFVALAFIFQPYFYKGLEYFGLNVLLFSENINAILLLCFLFALAAVLTSYTSNFKRVVVPTIFNNLFVKVAIPALILLLYFKIVPANIVKPCIIGLYVFILSALIIYLYSLGQLKIKINFPFYKRPLLSKMATFATYGILGSIGGVMAFRIDSIMVSSMIDLKSNSIYNIAFFLANVIAIPFTSINAIASPIIAGAWKENDTKEITSIYQKSSLTLLIAGLFIFLLVWSSLDDIFRLTPRYEELMAGKYVVFFLGLGKLIDMTTGLNNQIISFSKFFRFNLIAILFLAIINVVANYTLIPKHQIVGAAMATALSLVLFNLLKFIFIWATFKMQPFTWASIKVLCWAAIAYIVVWLMPSSSFSLFNIFYKSILICCLFGIPLLYFNISPDISNMVFQGRDKVLQWLKGKK